MKHVLPKLLSPQSPGTFALGVRAEYVEGDEKNFEDEVDDGEEKALIEDEAAFLGHDPSSF